MSITQNEKIRQVTEQTLVVGVDIASEVQWARAFDWRGIELGQVISFENSLEGFAHFTGWISELCDKEEKTSVLIGAEPTGHYWFTLGAYLRDSGVRLVLVNPYHVKPLYGATFLLYDMRDNLLGEYTTDQAGIISFARNLKDGRYKIKEIEAPDGYVLDQTIRTVTIKEGTTTEVEVKNTPIRGNIQIVKKSADYNDVTKLKKGALLEDAVFEIFDKYNTVVDRITTDSRGTATSKDLPVGIYGIREITAPKHYILDDKVFYAEIKIHGDLIKFEVLNESEELGVDVQKFGNYEAMPGDIIRYDFDKISNTSTVSLDDFYWRDVLPTDAVRLNKIVTGTWSERLTYEVEYRTNKRGWRTLEDDLSTKTSHTLDCSRSKLHLRTGEYITEFRFQFGTVQEGFTQVDAPYILCSVKHDHTIRHLHQIHDSVGNVKPNFAGLAAGKQEKSKDKGAGEKNFGVTSLRFPTLFVCICR